MIRPIRLNSKVKKKKTASLPDTLNEASTTHKYTQLVNLIWAENRQNSCLSGKGNSGSGNKCGALLIRPGCCMLSYTTDLLCKQTLAFKLTSSGLTFCDRSADWRPFKFTSSYCLTKPLLTMDGSFSCIFLVSLWTEKN